MLFLMGFLAEISDDIIGKRRYNLLTMIERFGKFSEYIATICQEPYEKIGPHAFPMIVKETAGFTRDKFVFFLEQRGIDSRSLFLSMPTQCHGFGYLGYKLGDFPEAEYIGENGLHIGVHQEMDREDLDYVLSAIRSFCNNV